MIGIIIALPSEAKSLLTQVESLKEIPFLDKKAYSCTINSKQAVIVISGIGKVSAALTTQALIDQYNPEFVVNAGTCGGTNLSVKPLNFYIVDKCFQFDFDVTEIDDVEVGYIQEYDTKFFNAYTKGLDFLPKTNLATADRFSNAEKDLDLIEKNGCAIRDMEGAAIAQTCKSNNVPFVSLKGVSDVYGLGTDGEQFYQNLTAVSKALAPTLIKVIESL